MKIRHILYTLNGLLGLLLAIACFVAVQERWNDYKAAQHLQASNLVRERLLRAEQALLLERSSTYNAVNQEQDPTSLGAARMRADEQLDLVGRMANASASEQEGARWGQDLRAARQIVDQAQLGGQTPADDVAITAFADVVSRIISEMQQIRLGLLTADLQYAGRHPESLLRYYTSLFSEAVSRNELPLARAASEGWSSAALRDRSLRLLAEADSAFRLIVQQGQQIESDTIKGALEDVTRAYVSRLRPLQEMLLEDRPVAAAEWSSTSAEFLNTLSHFQATNVEVARDQVNRDLARAQGQITFWLAILLLGMVGALAVIMVVRMRIVAPIERLVGAMSSLAEDDVETIIPRLRRDDEIGAMSSALRVFKANAIRRLRLQKSQQELHARLKQAYRNMRGDLEAAAAVQRAMLPKAGKRLDVRFDSLFRPSALVAGDTFDVLSVGTSKVRFFLIDVSGHGAQAALVSAAAHTSLARSMLARDFDGLPNALARLNADWPEDLPYLTLVAGEVDTRSNELRLVQAGHPPPVLIRSCGELEQLGTGGLPIGLLSEVHHEELVMAFSPGDRLVLYSDGLTEAEDKSGEEFGTSRLASFWQAHQHTSAAEAVKLMGAQMQHWRGNRPAEDDLTLVVLERENMAGEGE
jgi:serine phosphatase RsbU (regulator of sigma subunit)